MDNELKVTYTPSEAELMKAWVRERVTFVDPSKVLDTGLEAGREFYRFLQARDAEKFEEGRNAAVRAVLDKDVPRMTLEAVIPQPENPYKEEQ
jgi:hypothetical protein